jgi:predicted Zn-dependent peptidase
MKLLDGEIRETTLDNGIRVATERVAHSYGVSLGVRVDGGARDETDERAGISHLLEHMVFKGTERRTARDIAEELDAVGGQLDAYTTREYTGYGARVLPEHVPLALEILADMLRNSLLAENDLELEKSVILEEHRSLEDTPEELVHEVFARTLWPAHPLGRPVIGFPQTISGFTRDDLADHLQTTYLPERMICVAAGAVDHDALVRELEARFGDMAGAAPARGRSVPETKLERLLMSRPVEQAHFCMGAAGVDETDPDRWAVRVVNLILGGGMSSRLFQEIREKRGLCYCIGSETVSYREGGVFTVYADTSLEHLQEVHDLCRKELLEAARHGVTAEELTRAKDQVRAATFLSLDDSGSRMSRLARGLFYHDRVIPLAELAARVEAVTVDDCRRAAERLFAGGEFAFAAIGPFGKRKRARRT